MLRLHRDDRRRRRRAMRAERTSEHFDGSLVHVQLCRVQNLREQLETSLGPRYSVERELGGGGMSRVFLAEETQLGRKVVIKLLAPEFGEGLSQERFEREIRLAAGLQEPHIVPVISAGLAA